MKSPDEARVFVDLDGRGHWLLTVPGTPSHVECSSLEDARRLAYAWAKQRRPCELVVRDAYHRVMARELLELPRAVTC